MLSLSTFGAKEWQIIARTLWVGKHLQGQIGEATRSLLLLVYLLDFLENDTQPFTRLDHLGKCIVPATIVQDRFKEMRVPSLSKEYMQPISSDHPGTHPIHFSK